MENWRGGHLPAGGTGDAHHGPHVAQAGVESDRVGGSEAGTLEAGHHHLHTVGQALLCLAPVLSTVLQSGVDDTQSVVSVPLARPHHPPSGIVSVSVGPLPAGVTQPPLLSEGRGESLGVIEVRDMRGER